MEENQSFKLHSDEIKQIASALSKASSSIKPALKSAENPFFKSSYADLKEIDHACRLALTENELAISQVTIPIDGIPFLVTILMHSSGEWIKSYYPITYDKSTPQAIGSGVTYARRYSLAAICNVVTEDDDGEAATKREKEIPKKIQAPPQDTLITKEYVDAQITPIKVPIPKTAKQIYAEKLQSAKDLIELQSLISECKPEWNTAEFKTFIDGLEKALNEKFAAEMKEVFNAEEVKPTFEEVAIKHSKTSKPKGAK